MDTLLGIPMILGIVEVVKFTEFLNKRYIPAFALVVGVVVFLVFGDNTWQLNSLEGIVAALSAMGLWSGTKTTVG